MNRYFYVKKYVLTFGRSLFEQGCRPYGNRLTLVDFLGRFKWTKKPEKKWRTNVELLARKVVGRLIFTDVAGNVITAVALPVVC